MNTQKLVLGMRVLHLARQGPDILKLLNGPLIVDANRPSLLVLVQPRGGHLEILQWLRENNCPWDEWTCNMAATKGDLEILKWARDNECPWSKATCFYAINSDKFEVLQWLKANGCPWDKKGCLKKAEKNSKMVEWINEYQD